MTLDEDMDSSSHPILARLTTVLLFVLVQAGAVLLVGLTAFFLDVVPGWPAEGLPARAKLSLPAMIGAESSPALCLGTCSRRHHL